MYAFYFFLKSGGLDTKYDLVSHNEILPQYSHSGEDLVIFNVWAASCCEIWVFFTSIYWSEGSDTINLQFGLLRSHPENPRGREVMCMRILHSKCAVSSTEWVVQGGKAERHPQPLQALQALGPSALRILQEAACVLLLVYVLATGWHIPQKLTKRPWEEMRAAGNWSSVIILPILMLPCFGHIIK